MQNTFVVVGLQWGDEGKGKIIDLLAPKADMVVRFQGGNNAGHTVIINNNKFVLHLLPSGVLNSNITCVIASGVVVDLQVLLTEISNLEAKNINTNKILISNRANLIMPYHIKLDALQEEALGDNKIGTTKRGIGPCYADKYSRLGIRVADLLDEEVFASKLKQNLEIKNAMFTKLYNSNALDFNEIYTNYVNMAKQIKHRVVDSTQLVNQYVDDGKKVLFEGAQAAMLDIDFGTYPFVTSSNPIAGAITTGVGIACSKINNVFGVSKAYTTRVGSGPFVTELNNTTGDYITEKGNEYGSTTKRKRRCGWLDLVVLKYAIMLNGVNNLIITKLDVLADLPEIKVCIGYEINGVVSTEMPAIANYLQHAKPVYKTFKGFTDISNIRDYNDLPQPAKDYILFIKHFLKVDIAMVSVGPERNQNIIINSKAIQI